MKITLILLLGLIPTLHAATGFIALGTTNDGTTHTLTNTTTFDVVQSYVSNTTSGNFTSTLTAGNGDSPLPTRIERTTSWSVSGDGTEAINISFNSLGSLDNEITRNIPQNADLIVSGGEEANTQYRTQFTTVGNVSEIIITQDYTVGWSPFRTFQGRVWEGLALNQSSRVEMQLFDENLMPLDLSSASWRNPGFNDPDSYLNSGLTAVRETSSRDLFIVSMNDGDETDDFIGRAVYTITPTTGTYFTEGAFFAHTVNGQTFADAPTVNVPEPNALILTFLSTLTFLIRKRK